MMLNTDILRLPTPSNKILAMGSFPDREQKSYESNTTGYQVIIERGT